MKMKKILAAVLSLLMLLALFPTVALAADGEGSGNAEGIVVSKTAELADDGTYTINLEAYATGTTTTVTEKSNVPLDVVMIIDQSGSMDDYLTDLKAAVLKFIDNVRTNALADPKNPVNHRIAIVGFASNGTSYNDAKYENTELFIGRTQYNYNGGSTGAKDAAGNYGSALQDVSTDAGYNNLVASKNALDAYGGTYPSAGYEMANGIFNANPNTDSEGNVVRNRIIVFFTDGEPGDGRDFSTNEANSTIGKAYTSKNTYGATVYTVGFYSNASTNVTNFMNYLSSNYPNAQSMSATTKTEEVYTPVYSVDQAKTYYVYRDNQYRKVTWRSTIFDSKEAWREGFGDGDRTYTPKTGADDAANTQFYERTEKTITTGGPGEKADSKYYMTTSDSSELEKIFQTISQDIETPSTSVTLGSSSVMKDIIGTAFDLPDGFTVSGNITVKTVAGSTTDGTTINWGAENDAPAGVIATADTENNKVEVTGFDYAGKYIAPSHDGEKLVVTITGVVATEAAATGEAVPTNGELSGIYENGEAAVPVKKFDQPLTVIGNKTYVLDYAKPADLTELGQSVTHLDADSMQKIIAPDLTGFAKTYGKVSYNDGTLTYTPNTTNWDGYDSFFAFGTKDSGYSWSKVSVLPANNVYYEDDFITGEDGVALGIVYSGEWTVDGTAAGNTETANSPVQGGWVEGDTGLSDDAAYSDGSAHKADASSGNKATATFTFTGTGVDIYSKTDMTTGTIIATLKNSANNENKVSKTFIVDNKSASGTYYQIPTVTFSGLDHGEYTVTITVTTGAANDGNRCTYYLDGIRVYNPIKDKETDSTVSGAYGEDNLNVTFAEVRSILIDAANSSGAGVVNGAVFIDQVADDTKVLSPVLGTYEDYGPKHEVYLATGQSISFNVTGGNFYVGLKAPNGATTAEFTNNGEKVSANIGHASDLFYLVAPDGAGNVVIQNTGSNLLSVTKLRFVGDAGIAAISVENAVQSVSNFRALSVSAYTAVPVSEDELDQPEATEPEDPEVTEPETPAEEGPGDVVIDNPTEPEKPADEVRNELINWLTDLFNSMRKIIGRR